MLGPGGARGPPRGSWGVLRGGVFWGPGVPWGGTECMEIKHFWPDVTFPGGVGSRFREV